MLYTSLNPDKSKRMKKTKHYRIAPGQGNEAVAPDTQDLERYRKRALTERGFALNYESKLGSREAHEWMQRVAGEAIHENVVLIGEEYRVILAERIANLFAGQLKFRYAGEIK
jgi:hypothetical protein